MDSTSELIRLPGERVIEVFLGGEPTGYPVVMHHGTPGEMHTFADWHTICGSRGVRLICMSRPGYAGSSRRPGRSVADAAHDVALVLDALGHETFATVGWSGGGPHALACAGLLPERCIAAASLAGVGPYAQDDFDFLAGMGPENVEEFGVALEGEEALRRWYEQNASDLKTITGEGLAEALGGLVPDVDKRALAGAFAEHLAAVFRHATSAGFDGWIDDDLAFVKPWGFDPAGITVPVTLWQGDQDLMVPAAHERWLARTIPGAERRLLPGEGHISLVSDFREDVLAQLLRDAQTETAGMN